MKLELSPDMFSLFSKCVKQPDKTDNSPKITLLVVGLDNAGKTTTAKGLQGEPQEGICPTIGFSNSNFMFHDYNITLYDLGGGKKFRNVWKNYYADCHGFVFVVDTTDSDRVEECKTVLSDMVANEKVATKPILLVANKYDQIGAMDENDVIDGLDLERLANETRTPTRVEMCNCLNALAVKGRPPKMDEALETGFKWLCDLINAQWARINGKVVEDLEKQKKEEADERKKRQERVRKAREEREKREIEEGVKEVEEEEGDARVNGDPFKPLNFKELEEKEKRLKEEQRRKRREKRDAPSPVSPPDSREDEPAPPAINVDGPTPEGSTRADDVGEASRDEEDSLEERRRKKGARKKGRGERQRSRNPIIATLPRRMDEQNEGRPDDDDTVHGRERARRESGEMVTKGFGDDDAAPDKRPAEPRKLERRRKERSSENASEPSSPSKASLKTMSPPGRDNTLLAKKGALPPLRVSPAPSETSARVLSPIEGETGAEEKGKRKKKKKFLGNRNRITPDEEKSKETGEEEEGSGADSKRSTPRKQTPEEEGREDDDSDDEVVFVGSSSAMSKKPEEWRRRRKRPESEE